jgi:hypothetical protein
MKLSLHESGVWAWAGTQESGVKFGSNRRANSWRRPPEFASGWTRGPSISVIRFQEEFLSRSREPDKKPVVWLGVPPVGHARFLTIYFATDPTADPRDVVTPYDFEEVGSFQLRNGERVWMVSAERVLQADECKDVRKESEDLRVEMRGRPTGDTFATLHWLTTEPEWGQPLLVEIPLSPANLVWKDAAD